MMMYIIVLYRQMKNKYYIQNESPCLNLFTIKKNNSDYNARGKCFLHIIR